MTIAWLVIQSRRGNSRVPVDVERRGPKRSLVRLKLAAELPAKDRNIWRPWGHRTWVPTGCLHLERPGEEWVE